MEISIEEIQLLARRSRLALTEAEMKKYAGDLAALEALSVALLPYAEAPDAPPLQNVAPVLREDLAKPSLDTATVLANAGRQSANCFTVPRVIEEVEA